MNEERDIKNWIYKTEQQIARAKIRLSQIKYERDIAHEREIFDNFSLRNDHVKLLKRMVFESIWHGDLVSIGVSGKRPFGSSNQWRDIAEILSWELPNDDLSNAQYEQAKRLVDELPLAVNSIIAAYELVKEDTCSNEE